MVKYVGLSFTKALVDYEYDNTPQRPTFRAETRHHTTGLYISVNITIGKNRKKIKQTN